jgi:hypothetical protein
MFKTSGLKTIPPININGLTRQSSIGSTGTQPLQIITQTVPSRARLGGSNQQSSGFWVNPSPNSSLITINNQTQQCCESTVPLMKPPQTLRSRPISAGGGQILRRLSKETATSNNSAKLNVWAKGSSGAIGDSGIQIDSDTYRLVSHQYYSYPPIF